MSDAAVLTEQEIKAKIKTIFDRHSSQLGIDKWNYWGTSAASGRLTGPFIPGAPTNCCGAKLIDKDLTIPCYKGNRGYEKPYREIRDGEYNKNYLFFVRDVPLENIKEVDIPADSYYEIRSEDKVITVAWSNK